MGSPLPRTQLIRHGVVLAMLLGGLLVARSTDGRSLLVGLAMWSLIAVPVVAAGFYLSRRDGAIWPFLGSGRPYDGHGPD